MHDERRNGPWIIYLYGKAYRRKGKWVSGFRGSPCLRFATVASSRATRAAGQGSGSSMAIGLGPADPKTALEFIREQNERFYSDRRGIGALKGVSCCPKCLPLSGVKYVE